MAYKSILLLIISVSTQVNSLTCPGFPGYCSESFVGNTCVVVCAKGRPNVPLCQDDGTWTDIPRCVEHEPGKDEQIPGLCPGIGGYCSDGFLHHRCNFRCETGKLIDSKCTQDGTWQPYPTCPGDFRETSDGCNPCPGPAGGSRNRTLEGIQNRPGVQAIDRRVKAQQAALDNRFQRINSGGRRQQQPSNTINTGNRAVRPTFAGSLAFGPSSNSANSQSNIPARSNIQSFIPSQTKRPQPIQAPTPPAPMTRRPVSMVRQQSVSRPSSRPQQSFSSQSDTNVIEPQRSSPFLSIGPDGRIRADSDPNLSNSKNSGPAPNFQQQSTRRNQFSSGVSLQRNQNMFSQQSRGRRPQSSFTSEQRQIIQSALSKLPKSVRGGSNLFNQQGQNQPQQQQSSQDQFANFPQRQNTMSSTMAPRRLNFNPLRDQRPQMQQIQPQSSSRARPQPPTPPPRQSIQPQRQSRPSLPKPQPRIQATQPTRPAAPKKKLSALQLILSLQSKKGPTGAKNGGTPPPPTERPRPQQVMLFQEDNFNPRTLQSGNNGDSFGVFQSLNLGSPTESVQNGPQFQTFSAIPNTDRSSRVQAANDRFEGNSQFGVFETVQL